jgi:hypothetical protein
MQSVLPAYRIKYLCNKKFEIPDDWRYMYYIEKLRWIDKYGKTFKDNIERNV